MLNQGRPSTNSDSIGLLADTRSHNSLHFRPQTEPPPATAEDVIDGRTVPTRWLSKSGLRIFDYVDQEAPTLLRMFEKRLCGYRAIGYARGEAPLGSVVPRAEFVMEHDESVRRGLEGQDEFERETASTHSTPSRFGHNFGGQTPDTMRPPPMEVVAAGPRSAPSSLQRNSTISRFSSGLNP